MKILQAETFTQYEKIEKLYLKAFPIEERKPFSCIQEKQKAGECDILYIEDDEGEFCGLAITMFRDDLVLVDYLAMDENKRCRGYGSRTFQKILKYYHGKRLLIEIEDASIPGEDQENRIRRENFYHKNSMVDLHIKIRLCGVPMILLSNHTAVTYEEYIQLYQEIYGENVTKNICLNI